MRITGAKDLPNEKKQEIYDLIKQGEHTEAFCKLILALNINVDIPYKIINPKACGNAGAKTFGDKIYYNREETSRDPEYVLHEFYHYIINWDQDTDYWAEVFVDDLTPKPKDTP